MSIGPVQNFGLVTDPKAEDATPGVRQAQHKPAPLPEEETVQVHKSAEPEKPNPPKAASAVAGPQYEVRVLRDSQLKDQVVIKYMDKKTGNVILQVPSTQVLGVARGIYEELQEQAKNLAAAESEAEGSNGN